VETTRKSNNIWKAIAICSLFLVVLCSAALVFVGYMYHWGYYQPYTYNYYAKNHQWLPQIEEPKLRLFVDNENKDIYLDGPDTVLSWIQEKNCWDNIKGCYSGQQKLLNETRLTFLLYINGMEPFKQWDCIRTESPDFDAVFEMPPGSTFVFNEASKNNGTVLIQQKNK
jgi:hypothetical protein